MCEDIHIQEHTRQQWHLLQNLRSTVEDLLIDGLSNVWEIYGGLNRLHNVMEQIFKHGCRIFDQSGEPDCWIFIQGLNWLQPSLATSPTVGEGDYCVNIPCRISTKKDMLWLYRSLESHSLSQKLSWLLSDKEHLLSCLEPWAFLCQEHLAEAALICLKAVERNQSILLAEINPCLFLPTWMSPKASPRRHRRSSSYPTKLRSIKDEDTDVLDSCKSDNESAQQSVKSVKSFTKTPDKDGAHKNVQQNSKENINDIPLKTWNSLPLLAENDQMPEKNSMLPIPAAKTDNSQDGRHDQLTSVELSEIINIDYSELKQPNTNTVTDKSTIKPRTPMRKTRNKIKMEQNKFGKSSSGSSDTLNYEDSLKNIATEYNVVAYEPRESYLKTVATSPHLKIHKTLRRKTSFMSGSAPEFTKPWSVEIEGQKDIRTPKKSFMEDGGSSVQPMATGYFPRPLAGQSLTSFLSSAQFSRANAELDRENAHFSISEAMIAAIEQVKCNRQWRLVDEAAEESDEEINNLKRRIRLRRRQRQEERCKGKTWNRDLLSDGKTDTTTTDQSVSPLSTSPGTPSDSILTDDTEDPDTDSICKVSRLQRNGVTESDISSSPKRALESSLTDSTISAEGVALSLISKFSEKHLPRASELQWLVSEKDAPQQLLPLPKSWPVSPDEAEMEHSIPLRGTAEWAPPRPQIIFTPQPAPVRRTLIAKQSYRCAGCGMKVAVKYSNRFRYCEYLGRYFCTGCHTNQVSLIPGRILSKWDFNRYPVSNFSYRLLDQMTLDPLFQVNDLNPLLYRRIKQLDRTRLLRIQLSFLKDFLYTCRFGTSLQMELKKEQSYVINEPHVYSIQDLVHVKLGILPTRLQELVDVCSAHVSDCELCRARGFVCEICRSNDVIFPWELTKVTRCDVCGACFHFQCKANVEKKECPRCGRLRARRVSRDEPP